MSKIIKLLLVEDDIVDQMAFKRLVKNDDLPYDYHIAGSVSEAKSMLARTKFDIIISDYMLGDGSAFDLISVQINTPFIIATGAGDEGIAVKAMKLGAYDYLIKDQERNYLKVMPMTVINAVKYSDNEKRIRLLGAAVENANDSIIILEAEPTDLPGRKILYVNKAFTRMTGYNADEVIGKTLFMLHGPQTDIMELAKANKAYEQRIPATIEVANYRKDGTEFWVESNIVPFEEEKGWFVHWVSVQRDISARREYEEAMRVAKEAAERASNAKSDFLSTVSHELRTPLTSILGFTTIVKEDLVGVIFPSITEQSKKVERKIKNINEALEIMEGEARRLTALIDDVLDIAKIESGKIEWKYEEVDLAEIFKTVADAAAFLYQPKGLTLTSELVGHDFKLVVDRNRLKQVVTNLLTNAIKFTERGGISYRIVRLEDAYRCEITDTGIGISKENIDKVFEKFQQVGDILTSKPTGTGLGLPICKEIIVHHGGTMSVESVLGGGSKFCFTIPFERPKTFISEQRDSLLDTIQGLSRY